MDSRKISLSIGVKLVILCVMAVLLLIPRLLITFLVEERQTNAETVRRDIALTWGQAQTISSPLVCVPFVTKDENAKREASSLVFHPDSLKISARLATEERQRSIYKTVLYRAFITIEGYYGALPESAFPKNTERIDWQDAEFVQEISDVAGLKSLLNLTVDGHSYELTPAALTDSRSAIPTLAARVPIQPNQSCRYSISYELNGSQEILFNPQARETTVDLSLEWGNPSFSGRFLPDARSVTDTLTTASWKVLYTNTSLPLQRIAAKYDLKSGSYYEMSEEQPTFGVKTLVENDHYRMVNRAVKYAILLVIFTFLTFFFSDSFTEGRLPLIAYLLSGLAILLFYTLLLSISEYLTFGFAFLIASVAIVAMVSIYLWAFVRRVGYALVCAGVLTVLYAFLYVILQMDSFPLLVGSVLLFVILAVVMYLSHKLEW